MKISLLLLLALPLTAFAQFGRSYTGPTMQQNQQSRMDFNRMTNQRTQDFQQQMLNRHRSGGVPVTRESRGQAQAKQQQLEQEATEKLARLTQELQRKRAAHPAKNPQQAAAFQKADTRQLNQLAVKNYREVFLPGQLTTIQNTQQPAPSVEQGLRNLNDNLLGDAWWSQQQGTQLTAKVKACGDSLTAFATSWLGFDLAAPPTASAPFSVSGLEEQLAKDTFDQRAATQLLQEAALSERLLASDQLIRAVKEFNTLAATAATNPELQNNPKKLRKEVQKSLRAANKEMARYSLRLASSDKVYLAEKALLKSTSTYLAKK